MVFKQTITVLIVLLLFNQSASAKRVNPVQNAVKYYQQVYYDDDCRGSCIRLDPGETIEEHECQQGVAKQCYSLGLSYQYGRNGVGKNHTQAVKYYRKSCDGDSVAGCANLGYMYGNGFGVKKNYELAWKYYQQACDGGNAIGCNNLGSMYDDGKWLRKNNAMAMKHYRKACDLGFAKACGYAKNLVTKINL